MTEPVRPRCGEDDELRGELVDDDIEVVCLSCGTRFQRGTPHCRRCGRTDPVRGSQRMTRFARGTLLAVVGMREVLLCRSCDGEVAANVLHRAQLIPDDYASRFAGGDVREAPIPKRAARTRHRSPSSQMPHTVVAGSQNARRSAGQAEPATEPGRLRDPTVRQATESFLQQAREPVDNPCLVLLGTELGASTRLSSLDDQAGEAIGLWVGSKFGKASAARRELATTTITALVDHWLREEWLSTDIASALR